MTSGAIGLRARSPIALIAGALFSAAVLVGTSQVGVIGSELPVLDDPSSASSTVPSQSRSDREPVLVSRVNAPNQLAADLSPATEARQPAIQVPDGRPTTDVVSSAGADDARTGGAGAVATASDVEPTGAGAPVSLPQGAMPETAALAAVAAVAAPPPVPAVEAAEVLGVSVPPTLVVSPPGLAVQRVASEVVSNAASELNQRSQGLLAAMNDARLTAQLEPLVLATDLSRVASRRSSDMVQNGYFAHISPSGESWISLLNRDGIRVRSGGENLARVAGTEERSVAIAIQHLMDSPTHRANILGPYREVGVAAVTDEAGVTVFTAIFVTR